MVPPGGCDDGEERGSRRQAPFGPHPTTTIATCPKPRLRHTGQPGFLAWSQVSKLTVGHFPEHTVSAVLPDRHPNIPLRPEDGGAGSHDNQESVLGPYCVL